MMKLNYHNYSQIAFREHLQCQGIFLSISEIVFCLIVQHGGMCIHYHDSTIKSDTCISFIYIRGHHFLLPLYKDIATIYGLHRTVCLVREPVDETLEMHRMLSVEEYERKCQKNAL